MKKIFLLIFLSLLFSTCTQWRVSSLKPNKYNFIKNGTEPGQAFIKLDDSGLESLTTYLGIFNDKIMLIDNTLKRVQVMDRDGTVDLLIGNVKPNPQAKMKNSNFNFNLMGSFLIDKKKNIYVQNQVARTASMQKSSPEAGDFTPSYILVFNKEGDLQYTIGQRGQPDLPFYYIEFLDIDEKGRLFVISRSFDSWSVFRFEEKRRDYFINLSTLEFKEKEDENIYTGRIENLKIYESGESILLSVSYYHDMRFKYRKVYEYSLISGKIEKTIVTIPDPKNVLFNLVDDKLLYFWNVEKGLVKFMITNLEGNVVNNISLKIDDSNTYYSRLISDSSGKIFSYHIKKEGIEILQWE